MSEMNFLEKLLDRAEIKRLPLGEISKIGTGTFNRQDESENGIYPFYVRSKSILKSDTFQFDETAIIVPGEGGVGEIFHYVKGKYALHQRAYRIRVTSASLNTRYLYHFMSSCFKKYILTKSVGATSVSIRKPMLESFMIPIPCPEDPKKSVLIQAEIVRILDGFIELITELITELKARKKQYSYYRDKLFTFDECNVGWKSLGDVTMKSYSGATPKAGTSKYYGGGTIPWLRTQEVKFCEIRETLVRITPAALLETAAKWIPENCVIVAISGATAGRSAINKIPLTTNQHCCCLEIDPEKAQYRYIFHWVRKNYEKLKELGQGARGDLNTGIIKGFKIPIPYPNNPKRSLEEQERISSVLDKFDVLTNSISEGLPREIELRQKQYEYYRDLLLNFPKPEEVAG